MRWPGAGDAAARSVAAPSSSSSGSRPYACAKLLGALHGRMIRRQRAEAAGGVCPAAGAGDHGSRPIHHPASSLPRRRPATRSGPGQGRPAPRRSPARAARSCRTARTDAGRRPGSPGSARSAMIASAMPPPVRAALVDHQHRPASAACRAKRLGGSGSSQRRSSTRARMPCSAPRRRGAQRQAQAVGVGDDQQVGRPVHRPHRARRLPGSPGSRSAGGAG